MDNKPLYYFGYGLSYTKFRYSNLRLEKAKIRTGGSVKVKVDVTNTGKMEGDEIVQMYIRDKFSSVTRPVKELKGVKRISLKPKETKTVIIEIRPEQLAFHDINMKYVVEPGDFEIMVGGSSRDEDLLKTTLTVG
jgi:beta-glucosidase